VTDEHEVAGAAAEHVKKLLQARAHGDEAAMVAQANTMSHAEAVHASARLTQYVWAAFLQLYDGDDTAARQALLSAAEGVDEDAVTDVARTIIAEAERGEDES
jgi:L-fucose mutarotase/ribose pyranase (RbsD/FucU family)